MLFRSQRVQDEPTSSRIDDVLICLTTLPTPPCRQPAADAPPSAPRHATASSSDPHRYTPQDWKPCPHDIQPCGEEGDHSTLTVHLATTAINYVPPPPTPQAPASVQAPRFATPMSRAQLLQLKDEISADPELSRLMFQFNSRTKERRTACELAHAATAQMADTHPADYEQRLAAALAAQGVASEAVEGLNTELQGILGRVLELARKVCDTQPAGGQTHCHTRTNGKRYSKLMALTRLLKRARTAAASLHPPPLGAQGPTSPTDIDAILSHIKTILGANEQAHTPATASLPANKQGETQQLPQGITDLGTLADALECIKEALQCQQQTQAGVEPNQEEAAPTPLSKVEAAI